MIIKLLKSSKIYILCNFLFLLILQAIHPFAFDKLGKLEYLEMNNNPNLDIIDHQLFTSLSNLRSLSLKNSTLTTLDPRLANLFKKLIWIQLSSRKFNCNCSVQWLNLLLHRIRANQPKLEDNSTLNSNITNTHSNLDFIEESYVICSLPESLSGTNLINLTTDQLGCYEVKSFIPVVIAIVVGVFILIAVIVICVINSRSSLNRMKRNEHDGLNDINKYNSGDHLASLHSFTNGPNLVNNTNNYAFKLGLYDGINRKTAATTRTGKRSQNKVFSTSDKTMINEFSRFDTMYKPPLIGSNNFSDILMPNSKSTLINTNKLKTNDDQPIIKCLTNPYQVVPVMPPGYEQDYFNQQQQQLLFQQQQHQKTKTLNSEQQFINHHFNQQNFHTQRIFAHRPSTLSYNGQQQQDDDTNEDYSDHTYATVLNGNEIYIGGSQDHVSNTINHTINPSHLRRLANSDCSSCSSEPLSRLSNDKPITEL